MPAFDIYIPIRPLRLLNAKSEVSLHSDQAGEALFSFEQIIFIVTSPLSVVT